MNKMLLIEAKIGLILPDTIDNKDVASALRKLFQAVLNPEAKPAVFSVQVVSLKNKELELTDENSNN